jgi:hypothetical protein
LGGATGEKKNENTTFYWTQNNGMFDCAPPVLSAKLRLWQTPYIFDTTMQAAREKI